MSVSGNKKKGRMNVNSNKMGRSKIYGDKISTCDGLYGNLRLMYATTSLVGCVVQIQVQSGAIFEGVLRTFSHQFDVVLEMAHRVNPQNPSVKGVSSAVQNLISSFPFDGGIYEKLVFKHCDIILLQACDVDLDYAVKDNFTDKAISKFDGHVKERELEPYAWEGGDSDSENTSLTMDDESGTNGWDANDMFRTNAEKYGITSSYDNTLPEYTVALTKKDTEEYKLQEAKALKIAHEIEASSSYQSKILLENGDEEDKYSAVVRPADDSAASKYVLPHKRRNPSGPKRQVSSPTYITNCMPYSPLYENKQYPTTDSSLPILPYSSSALTSSIPKDGLIKIPAGEKCIMTSTNADTVPVLNEMIPSHHGLAPRAEKSSIQDSSRLKGESSEIEELRKFSTCFKLSSENKESNETEHGCADTKSDPANLIHRVEQLKLSNEDKSSDVVKYSTLNPNAKEFVFNPNAKSFTPRSLPVTNPQPPLPVPSQSPVMHLPQTQLLQQPMFTAVAPQYVMQATPVSSPFVAASQISQAARYHKALSSQPPMQMQYTSSGVLHATAPPQQAVRYPQVNFVVGPPVVSPQTMGLASSEHSMSYCDTTHVPTHVIMQAHPGVPHSATPPHSLQQRPPQSQTPILHPSISPAPHSQPPTPPSLMYAFSQPPSLEASMGGVSHSGNHPGFSSGSHPLVLMQQPPTSLHHSIHLQHHPQNHHHHHHHMGTVHMLPQMTNVTAVKTTPLTAPPFVQHQ